MDAAGWTEEERRVSAAVLGLISANQPKFLDFLEGEEGNDEEDTQLPITQSFSLSLSLLKGREREKDQRRETKEKPKSHLYPSIALTSPRQNCPGPARVP